MESLSRVLFGLKITLWLHRKINFSKKIEKKEFRRWIIFFRLIRLLDGSKNRKMAGLEPLQVYFSIFKIPKYLDFWFSEKIEKSTSLHLSPIILRLFWAINQPDLSTKKNWFKKIAKIINPPPPALICYLKNRFFYDGIMQCQKFLHNQVELVS